MASGDKKKKRSTRWAVEQVKTLINGIEENSKVIQASFSMQVTSSTKKEAWQKITIMVSERSSFLFN